MNILEILKENNVNNGKDFKFIKALSGGLSNEVNLISIDGKKFVVKNEKLDESNRI